MSAPTPSPKRYPPVPLTTLIENLQAHLDYLHSYGMNWPPEEMESWIADHRRLLQHGTRGFHRQGCRCDWCMEADRRYERRRRKAGRNRNGFIKSILEDAL